MNSIENFYIGLESLKDNKLRTVLTMLGIIFGVGAVIAMLSIGEGAKQEALEQIELLGTNNIIVKRNVVSKGNDEQKFYSPGLNLNDINALLKIGNKIEYAVPEQKEDVLISYKSKVENILITGTSPEYPTTFNSKLSSGDFFSRNHYEQYSQVCVIGQDIKNEFFKFENPLGKRIKIDNLWFRVIGVMEKKGIVNESESGIKISNFNKDIYIPLSTLNYKVRKSDSDNEEEIVTDKNSIESFTIKIKSGENISENASLIDRILKRKHFNVKDYSIIIPEQLIEQKQQTQRIFNIVMGAIAGISLLVGGIGIMNIMLANIMERTKEIGIRRAVGATRDNVLLQFMYEAVIISLLGGLLGIVLGIILTFVISGYANWRTAITPFSIILAFFVSVAVGIVFGIYPAKKAAEKDPIESLRYE